MIISCPICHNPESDINTTVNYGPKEYLIVKCRKCSHYFSKIDLEEAAASDLYNDEVYKVIDNRDSLYSKIIDYEYSRILNTISERYPPGSRILDFGSGKGNFLFLAGKLGFKVMGIETAPERAGFAREKFNLTISETPYSGGPIDSQPFDVITLFHVLEHLPNPLELLGELIKNNLKPDGTLILEVPNLASLQSSIAGNRWMHLDIPRHISHFTDKRLIDLAEGINLKVIKKEYFSFHLGILGMSHSIMSLFGYQGKIIKDLKGYNFKIMLALLLTLPLAFILEVISAAFNKGGIIRIYCRQK